MEEEEEEEEDLLAPPSGGGGDEVSTPIKRLRAEIRTADRHEREVAREVEELEEEAQANLGPDGEYQPLWGKCFTLPHAQYTYEMCVGGEAQQKEGTGRGTGLGQWDGIEDEGEPDSSRGLPGKAFVFRHGDHCWNGPARFASSGSDSRKVKRECRRAADLGERSEMYFGLRSTRQRRDSTAEAT